MVFLIYKLLYLNILNITAVTRWQLECRWDRRHGAGVLTAFPLFFHCGRWRFRLQFTQFGVSHLRMKHQWDCGGIFLHRFRCFGPKESSFGSVTMTTKLLGGFCSLTTIQCCLIDGTFNYDRNRRIVEIWFFHICRAL